MQQGDVTTKQQEIPGKTVQCIFCTEQGVAGAKLFCLKGETQILARPWQLGHVRHRGRPPG